MSICLSVQTLGGRKNSKGGERSLSLRAKQTSLKQPMEFKSEFLRLSDPFGPGPI